MIRGDHTRGIAFKAFKESLVLRLVLNCYLGNPRSQSVKFKQVRFERTPLSLDAPLQLVD